MLAALITLGIAAAGGIATLAFRIKRGRQQARVDKAEADARVREANRRGR